MPDQSGRGPSWDERPMFALDADVTVYWPDVRPCYDAEDVGRTPSRDEEAAMSGGCHGVAANTPEMQKQDRRNARRRAVRHWLRCQWGRTGYRPSMRLLHRMNLCWMQPSLLRDGENGQWINVWCHWCGVRGKRLDMSRAMGPR